MAQRPPVLSGPLREQRRGRVGRSRYGEETSRKVKGGWPALYRAIDRGENLVGVYLRKTRDRAAAEPFFRSARTVTEVVPGRVPTDGPSSYPGALKA